ncbi:MAG: PEP/pyruvate-binding domain-containing protein [Planctomycetota bacterium]|jgi:pyruvate,water dikinase|nr:PEP/pyruvate-binding domain-containing protein [Planctomycetota bacterium]
MPATPPVLRLSEIRPEHREQVGEKAYRVAELICEGFQVPDGFVITAQARRDALGGKYERIASAIRRAVQALFENEPVAVRSSGTAEDLAGASFAGMYETELEIRGPEGVLAAAERCWDAARSERVRTYCLRAGIDPDSIELALLIQRMVPSESSGVLFTIDPTSGDQEEMACEAILGLGEALVSGQVTPDRYILSRNNGSIRTQTLEREEAVLNESQLRELVQTGRRVQRLRGAPQDIEFAFAEGALHLLQTRPITTLHFAERIGEWTTADFRDGGVSSAVCSPYMASLYLDSVQSSLPAYFATLGLHQPRDEKSWIRVFFGRPYWNVGAVKECVAKIPGFVERHFDSDLAIEVAYEGPGQTTPTNLSTTLRAIPVLIRLLRDYRGHLRKLKRLVDDFEAIESSYLAEDPWTLSREKLLDRYRKLMVTHYPKIEPTYFHTIYNLSNTKLDFQSVLDRANARGADLNYLELLSGIDELRTLAPPRDMHRLVTRIVEDPSVHEAFEKKSAEELIGLLHNGNEDPDSIWSEIEAYTRKYRYHSRKELDITVPRWDEDLPFVLETIRIAVRGHKSSPDPLALSAGQRKTYHEASQKARNFFGPFRILARRSFFTRLNRVRQYTWWREEIRDRSTRTYYLIRRETLALARRLTDEGVLDTPEEVWMLSWKEVLSLAEGQLEPAEARERIESNRENYESYREYDAPNEIGWRWLTGGTIQTPTRATTGEVFEGTAASPGRVEGVARIIRSVSEGEKLQPGDILVAPFTDPGWTPFLGIVQAVVTETGGLLSHAAVISREYGIPAVLAVKNATRILRDGQPIVVDGTRGQVEILEP